MGGQNSSIRGEPEEGDLKSALLMHVAREEARQDADDAIPTSGIINIPDNIPVPQLVSSSLSQFGFLEPLHESVPVLGTTASEGRAARHGDTYYNAPLSFGEELGWAAGLGLAGGLFTAVYSITLQQILRVVWDTVPEKLASSGLWTQDSAVPLQGYIVVAAVTLSVLGCLLATALPPHENISAWIGKVHTHGVAPIAWAAPMVVVSLLTVPSGASIGPEGVMIVAGGNLAG